VHRGLIHTENRPVCSVGTGSGGGALAAGGGEPAAAGGGEAAGCGAGAGGTKGPDGNAGAVKVLAHKGHFIIWPAYCSMIVSLRWQLGQRISMDRLATQVV